MTMCGFATAGHLTIFHLPVPVAPSLLSTMHKYASCRDSFMHLRHHDPTSVLAKCMKEVYRGVELEPPLQPLTGETLSHQTANTEPDARADIRVRGFWTDGRNAFFDTRVFYPHAPSYRSRCFQPLYRKFESDKKREYTVSASMWTSMAPSLLWFFQHVVGWAVKPL